MRGRTVDKVLRRLAGVDGAPKKLPGAQGRYLLDSPLRSRRSSTTSK